MGGSGNPGCRYVQIREKNSAIRIQQEGAVLYSVHCTGTPYRLELIPPGLDERVEPVQGVADGEGGVRDSHQQAAATAYKWVVVVATLPR